MKQIIRGMVDKSQVLDDCQGLLDKFKTKVEKITQMKKRIKQGDKACIEVLKQRKDIDETIEAMGSERQLIEATLLELQKLNASDLAIEILKPQ
jgi:hypothetical protein